MPGKPSNPVRGYSFSGFSANNPTAQQPGAFIDQELDRLSAAVAAAIAWANGTIGDDGSLKNGSIQAYHLAAGAASQIAGQVTSEALTAAAQATAAAAIVQAAVINGPVLSFNGRNGAVTPQASDYAAFYVQPSALADYATSASVTATLTGYATTGSLNSYAPKLSPILSSVDAVNAGGNITLSGANTNRNIKLNNNAGQFEVTDPANPAALSFVVTPAGLTYNGNTVFHSGNTNLLNSMARNAIINGAFQVNQRNYVSGAATTAGQYTFDRWKVTGTGGITFSTASGKTTITIPSGQTLQQVIEGLNLDTATYVLSWEGTAQGRINGGSYGNSGSVTAALSAGSNSTIEFGPGTVTRVKLEKGSTPTAFEVLDAGEVVRQCQRYYEIGFAFWYGYYQNSTQSSGDQQGQQINFKVTKRATPTMAWVSGGSGASFGAATVDYSSVTKTGAFTAALTGVFSATSEL